MRWVTDARKQAVQSFRWAASAVLPVINRFVLPIALAVIVTLASQARTEVAIVPAVLGIISTILWKRLQETGRIQNLYGRNREMIYLLLAEMMLVPAVFFALSFGWKDVPGDSVFRSIRWIIMSFIIGGLVAWRFEVRERRLLKGLSEMRETRTGFVIWRHNVLMPTAGAGIVFMMVPVLIHRTAFFGVALIALVLLIVTYVVLPPANKIDKKSSFRYQKQQAHGERVKA